MKDFLIELLRKNNVNIKFQKADGSIREMFCTLNPSIIPEENIPNGKKSYSSEKQIRVFDLEKGNWRSFNPERLIEFKLEKAW